MGINGIETLGNSDVVEVVENGKTSQQSRWRSPVLWAAVIGCIATVFSVFGVWEKIGITVDGFNEIAASVGAVLAAFGVLNDPKSKNSF